MKLVVGVDKKGWREDAKSIRAAARRRGSNIDLMIDANYLFNPVEAKLLCREIEDCNLTCLRSLCSKTTPVRWLTCARIRNTIAAGQMEGHRWLASRTRGKAGGRHCSRTAAFAVASPSAQGGHLAQIYNLPIANVAAGLF